MRLSVRSGGAAGRTIEASGGVVQIGRAPGNDLVLDDTHVSGEHARISVGAASIVIEDLHSTNGTAIVRSGVRRPLDETSGYRAPLETGDILELAEVVRNLALRDHEKGLSTGEKQMYVKAKKILASELMYAKDLSEDDAHAWLEDVLANPAKTRRAKAKPKTAATATA